jgi:hypothetical protein
MSQLPVILYIPGLKPKPEASIHQAQLLRCLTAGLRRVDAEICNEVIAADAFQLIAWTYDFYGEHRDIGLDQADIETVLGKDGPTEADIVVATSLRRRFAAWLFRVADFLPFLIPRVATEEVEVHLRDFNRYVRNRNGISEAAREKLKSALRDANEAGRPVLLIAHSMGSVIAYDALWQMAREENSRARVDLMLTTGSPLGQNIVQRQLFGVRETGERRYPDNIDHWVNIAAIGELTAIDRQLKNDFSEMLGLGLVGSIEDLDSFNYYHMHGMLNVHVEYGYLINEVTARAISDWWAAKRPK